MKNKIYLKKYLLKTLITILCLMSIFVLINRIEYEKYTRNFNHKINSIINIINEKYPNIDKNEVIEILNSEDSSNKILDTYGIDLDKESVILENDKIFIIMNTAEILILIVGVLFIVCLFLNFNNKKDKELNKITEYIKQINKKNYKLDIDSISEDELSILKSEVYKTTIMLKEVAENSLNDKKNLKDSLSDISHQIKTPLTSILLILDNLQDNPEMDENTKRDFIHDIKREIININFLVTALLKLSKLDAGTIEFNRNSVSLKEMCQNCIKNLEILCEIKNVVININEESDIYALVDMKWCTEALTNIVKNSVEHSFPNSTVTINITENKIYKKIEIIDTGEGIDSEDLKHIFERFYKTKNSKEESIGIGLSLASTIIEKNNGTMDVKSDKNGTKFIIKFFD